ncbi:hypothetical protein NVP1031O_187 [Vibrio phage 1.031.O._10N.261.46.F8]|nr:hypothetical protein NVP1031O_187 [Vibrio phage 1.031.O._10N.261.46.F8]
MSRILKIQNVSKAVIVLPIKPSGAHQFNPGIVEQFELATLRPNWQVVVDQMLCITDGEQVPSFKYNILDNKEEFVDPTPAPTPVVEKVDAPEPELPEMTDSVEVIVEQEEVTEPVAESATNKYSEKDLRSLPIKELRKVGAEFGVRGSGRDDLVSKVLNAQGE